MGEADGEGWGERRIARSQTELGSSGRVHKTKGDGTDVRYTSILAVKKKRSTETYLSDLTHMLCWLCDGNSLNKLQRVRAPQSNGNKGKKALLSTEDLSSDRQQ